jgi:hypothetical protein
MKCTHCEEDFPSLYIMDILECEEIITVEICDDCLCSGDLVVVDSWTEEVITHPCKEPA